MSDDLISRAKVFERLEYTRPPEGGDSTKERFRFLQWLADNQIIKETPSAEPQITLESAVDFLHSIGWMQEHDRILTEAAQRRGKWIPKDERWHCTLCDGIAPKGIRWKFCPICGGRMEGTERQRAAEGNDAGSKREET